MSRSMPIALDQLLAIALAAINQLFAALRPVVANYGVKLRHTGLHTTSHKNAPIALPNLMQVAWETVNRASRSGTVIGHYERVTPYEAMKINTIVVLETIKNGKTVYKRGQ